MKTKSKVVKKLNIDARWLEQKIKHRKLFNILNLMVRFFLKTGIAIDYFLPFIISSIILINSPSAKNNPPFQIDTIKEKASIELIDTSSGIHLEHISQDFNYKDELIEHSTGWITDDNGLYERTVTSYRLSNKINLNNPKEIISMTKEEIEETLVITNIKTIKKNTLTPEDSIYNKEAIIVINHSKTTEEFGRLETGFENFMNSLFYIILVAFLGSGIKFAERVFVKMSVSDRLKEYEPLFRHVSKEELDNLKKVLELKKENLAILNDVSVNIKDKSSCRIRRK